MLSTNTIMSANTVQRIMGLHNKDIDDSIRKLASGERINRAADDPAGLAVSELMRANIAAMQQGMRNTNDAISLAQTADGALMSINDNLIRMKELSEQAATGTYSAEQREMMNVEYQELAAEIDRISNATSFNGIKLLNGSIDSASGGLKIHFGPTNSFDNGDFYNLTIPNMSSEALGVNTDLLTQGSASDNLEVLDNAIKTIGQAQAHVGAVQNRLDSTSSNLAIMTENTIAAESRIRDVNVAEEMTKLTTAMMRQEVAAAMLAQANASPQLLMQLYK